MHSATWYGILCYQLKFKELNCLPKGHIRAFCTSVLRIFFTTYGRHGSERALGSFLVLRLKISKLLQIHLINGFKNIKSGRM